MTRKKSRPQHRETSPESANEGGFYKMFWNSMEGDNDAPSFPPNEHPRNSPAVIVINDSDDENPYSVDENSSDVPLIPHPIKQEEVLVEAQTETIARETAEDQSGDIHVEKTIEDCVSETLQPTSLVHLTEQCGESINSSRSVADQTSESVILSPDLANSHKESFPVPHDHCNASENNIDLERTADNDESSSPLPGSEAVRNGSQPQENGNQCRDLEGAQVCSIVSPSHQVDDRSGTDCSVSLDSLTVANENRCEGDGIPVNDNVEAITNSSPVMSSTTGQALELLKSLLVTPDDEESSISTPFSTESNVNINSNEPCNMPVINNPQIKKEIAESQCLTSNVTLSSSEPNIACSDDEASSVVQSAVLHSESPAVVQPTTVTQQADICQDPAADEFPAFGLVLPFKIKIESDCKKRSLDLLKNELLNLYNNCHVKIAFERKTDVEIAENSIDVSDNEEVEPYVPNGTAPCRVMVERLPTPMVRKGYVALSSKAFQNWKSRIIRLRNEEQFRHLGVWRRGRTRLWRECQLAGMDKLSYDKQVSYIRKHIINETSSSSEAESSDDEFYNQMFETATVLKSDNKLQSNALSSPPCIITRHSGDSSPTDDVTKPKSPHSKSKVRGFKSMKNQYRYKAVNEAKTPGNDGSPCRDEYVVEQSTVQDPHSGGKKTAPLKITIRKTSVNKSEDEREKSVESEVENNFTVPFKPTNKKMKRNFITKRTYRKLEDQNLLPTDKLIENEQQKKRRVQPTPHYVDDNNEDEESLLGRRSYEVENFNLLEKWDIPFEEPTLFRSPRIASRLAQLKTKEAFTRKIRAQPAPQKSVPLCKEVKEVVEMLCSRTVEAMLCPDATSSALQVSPNMTLEAQSHGEEGQSQILPETEEVAGKTTCDEDMSETQSVTYDETSSTVDTSECGDSPKKAKKRKKTKFNYRKKKAKAKPSLKTVDTSSNDAKVVELCTKVPKVLISPLQSTQVPVVSEGPGQSPQESEDDVIHPVGSEGAKNKGESASLENEKLPEAPLDKIREMDAESSDHVSPAQNARAVLTVPPMNDEEGATSRVTRSKQPSIAIDPDILENFGIRKKSRKTLDRKNTTSDDVGNASKSSGQSLKSIPKKRGKTSLQGTPSEEKNSDLNTQVHEISEGPGEVMERLPNVPSQDSDASVVEECIESRKNTLVKPNKIIPDSPMSPDAVEDEQFEPRMTRSKKRMMREGSAYIAVKKNNSSEDDLPSAEPVTKLCAETVQHEGGSTEKVAETESESQHASLDGDKSVTASSVDSEKTSTDVAEETVENMITSDCLLAVSEETPVIQEKQCFESTKSLGFQPQPELVTKISSDADDPSLAATQQISSLIHQPELVSVSPSDTAAPLVSVNPSATTAPSLSAGATQPQAPENLFTNEVSHKTTLGKGVSQDTEGSSSPSVDPNTSRERKAVLETLNSILKLSSQNKKIADSLTSRGSTNLFDKEPTIELRNASDDECDSGDAADGLVVDEDRDFSDDDDNSAELASRIDQIIKDQIKRDIEPTGVKATIETETGNAKSKELAGKRRDSIDERTGLPTAFIQKLRDPRIRSKLLSRLEENDELVPNEASALLPVNQADSNKAPLSDKHCSAIRDPRTLRTVTDPCGLTENPGTMPVLTAASVDVPTDQAVVRSASVLSSASAVIEGRAVVPPVSRNPAHAAAVLRGGANPVALNPEVISISAAATTSGLRVPLLPTPTCKPRGPLLPTPTCKPRGPLLPTPTTIPVPAVPLNKPRLPLLPTPTALLPTVAELCNSSPAVHSPHIDLRTNEVVEQNTIDETDEDEEECLKRRPKKQKKELDTELMYRSPLEDLQSEARPTYGRNLPRRNPRNERRNISRNEQGSNSSTERRPSRWDVRYNDRRLEEDHHYYPGAHPVYKHDRWGGRQENDQVSRIPCDPHSWKPRNWHPEYNTNYNPPHPNEMVCQEPRLSYMDTKLLNLSLLPKTTNLSAPPFTKIYTYFNYGNPQILGIAPPTYDPNEKASTITMMDPMGQEMIDIVQLPRPTSGLTSDYFNDLPEEFSLEELVTHPYLALSDMMDEEVEIENHGTNIFDDSDEERRVSRVNVASRRLANDPRNRPPVLHEKTDNVKIKEPQKLASDDPLENILHCLPALKEQYSFKKVVDLEDEDSDDKPIAPPPPVWSNDLDLRQKEKQPEKTRSSVGAFEPQKNWRNPSPPKVKLNAKTCSPTSRSRSKSPPHRKIRRRSRSKSPARRQDKSRSRSPRSRRRSRSNSPKYRKGRSRSNSLERLGRVRIFKRSRSRSPSYHHNPSSAKRHSRR